MYLNASDVQGLLQTGAITFVWELMEQLCPSQAKAQVRFAAWYDEGTIATSW